MRAAPFGRSILIFFEVTPKEGWQESSGAGLDRGDGSGELSGLVSGSSAPDSSPGAAISTAGGWVLRGVGRGVDCLPEGEASL